MSSFLSRGRKGSAVLAWAVLCLCLTACSSAARGTRTSDTPTVASPSPTETLTPSPTPVPTPTSWLRRTTLLTIYGRAFGVAPILGRLGMDSNFAEMRNQIQPFLQGIRAHNGGKAVRVAIHLIYALASPCSDSPHCLVYLDDAGVDIVRSYILPAARLGWVVILDDQLGSSWPAAEVRRMAAKGYLRYENVAVAIDPEFRAGPGQPTPGIPIGAVGAREINRASSLLGATVSRYGLRHHRLLLVHQFQPAMIQHPRQLQTSPANVDLVIVADGFGSPGVKMHVYSDLIGPQTAHRLRWRGIKLFYPNPNETAGHGDYPLMTWGQIFGRQPGYHEGNRYFVRPPPNVVVIA